MLEDLWNGVLDLSSKLVIPDWGSLVALIPIGLLVLVALWLVRTAYRFSTAGPTRRAQPRPPLPPPDVHTGPVSPAPVLAALGAFVLFWGLVVGGAGILVGVIALVLGLLWWGREGLRDYDHLVHAEPSLPVVHAEPPAGVHMPGPSFRPILASLGVAVLFFGLVFGGWLLLVGLLFTITTLLGWLVDARKEYVNAVEADRTGHLQPLPAPGWPKRVLWVFSVLVVAALVVDAGILPPRTEAGGTPGEPGASPPPGGSPPPGSPPGSGPPGSPGASLPAGDVTITAVNTTFTTPNVTAPADRPFAIVFDNQDQGQPHDVDISDANGGSVFDGEITTGPAVTVYEVPAMAAGAYDFRCSVHANMTGTITAQ